MKKLFIVIAVCCTTLLFHSCSPQYVTKSYITNVGPDWLKNFEGKDKEYIIENFIFSITDIKRLDETYEILIAERSRPLVGNGITKFYLKNGKCYDIQTNEMTEKTKTIQVSFLDWFFGNY